MDKQEYRPLRPVPSLNISELRELDCHESATGYSRIYLCEPASKYRGACPKCGKSYNHYGLGNLENDRFFHDVSTGLIHNDLQVRIPRYRCNGCGKTFTHPFNELMPKLQFTRRLYEQIQRASLKLPFSSIAKEHGISVPTVLSIFEDYATSLDKAREAADPKALGLDEKYISNKPRGVLVDIENGELLEMTAKNDKGSMKLAVESLKGYGGNVKVVTIDMCSAYVAVARECLPNAKIVIDVFHVIQNLYRKIEIKCLFHPEAAAEPHSVRKAKAVFRYPKRKRRPKGIVMNMAYSSMFAFPKPAPAVETAQASGGGASLRKLLEVIGGSL